MDLLTTVGILSLLALVWGVKRFMRFDPKIERKRTQAFLSNYYRDK